MAANNTKQEQKELEPAPTFTGKTTDIQQELDRLKNEYKDNYKPLIPRKLIPININESDQKNKDKDTVSLKIMQFNILADGLSSVYEPNNEMFKAHRDRKIEQCLHFGYRGFRLIEEMTQYAPDIITCQEVDQIGFITAYLAPFGYKYVHCIKPKSPVKYVSKDCGKDLLPDGSAVFWNANVWKELETYTFGKHLDKSAPKNIGNLAVAVVRLQNIKNESKQILVAATHLKAHFSMESDIKRIAQLLYILPKLKQLCQSNGDIPLFIGADFNSTPMDMINPWQKNLFFPFAYQSVVNGKCLLAALNGNEEVQSEENKSEGQMCIGKYDFANEGISDGVKLVLEALKAGKYENEYGLGLKNAYCFGGYKGKEFGNNPSFTCTLGGLHCLDFIFFQPSKGVTVTKLLETLSKDENMDMVTPCWEYPSDHFSLLAEFAL